MTESPAMRKETSAGRVFRYLYHADGDLTKKQVAQGLGLSMPTIYQAVSALQEQGLVEDGKELASTGGRRATSLRIAPSGAFSVGVSVSKRDYTILACDLLGQEIAFERVLRQSGQGFENAEVMGQELNETISAFLERPELRAAQGKGKLAGVGVAVPGVIDAARETIVYAPTLGLHDFSYEGVRLEPALGLDIQLYNDANCAGFAEWFFDPSSTNVAYLLLEDGVGGSFLLDGASYGGDNGRSAEFGHICVEPGGRECSCGRHGCLEAYCSVRVIEAESGMSVDDFFMLLEEGDARMQPVWEDYASHLAMGIAAIRMTLDCPIVLSGFLARYLRPHLADIRARVTASDPFTDDASYVTICQHPAHAVPRGAALRQLNDFVEAL